MSQRFIISPGRTGTKTLAKLFDEACEESWKSLHEPQPTMQEESVRYHTGEETARGVITTLRESRDEAFGKAYFESNGHLSYIMPLVLEAFPACHMLFIVRNPASWIRSGKAHNAMRSGVTKSRRVKPAHLGAFRLPEDGYTPSLWRLNWLFTQAQILFSLHPRRFRIVRYEDLFVGNLNTLLSVGVFFDVEIDAVSARRILAEKHNASAALSDFVHYDKWPGDARRFTENVIYHWLELFDYDIESVYPNG